MIQDIRDQMGQSLHHRDFSIMTVRVRHKNLQSEGRPQKSSNAVRSLGVVKLRRLSVVIGVLVR